MHVAHALDAGDRVIELRTAPDAKRAVLDATPGDVCASAALALRLIAAVPARALVADRPTATGSGAPR